MLNRHALKKLSQALPERATVADIGCGNGETLHWFKQQNLNNSLTLLGCDVQQPLADICFSTVNFETQQLPMADNQCDLVISQHVIEHLHNPLTYFSELVRITSPAKGKSAVNHL